MREKRLLHIGLFVGTIFFLGGLLWLGSEVVRWLKHDQWNIFSLFDVIGIFFPTAGLDLDAWLYEPRSWFGLHKLLHGLIGFIYRAFLYIPFSAIVILIGGGLYCGCRDKLKKMEHEELLEKIAKMRRRKKSGGRTPRPQKSRQ